MADEAPPVLTAAQRSRARMPWFIAYARVRSPPHRKVRLADTLAFFRQTTTLLRGGTPILEAIQVAGDESESLDMRRSIQKVAARVAAGQAFANAAMSQPEVFNEYWCQLIRTGESSGNLPQVLERLVVHLEAAQHIRNKIAGAMAYPIILISISLIGLFVMLWKVVPTFTGFFKDFGGTLPPITKFVIGLSDFFAVYGVHCIVVATVGYKMARSYVASPTGLRQVTNVILCLPTLGDLAVNSAMQKFCANLALLLRSGTPLLESLEIIQSLFNGFPAYRDALNQVYLTVTRGADLASSLEGAHLFTPLLTSMVRVGEQTGELIQVLDQLDKFYTYRTERLLEAATGLIEPLTIVFMGVVIGGLLTSIYIPMFKMSSGSRL
jgi:type IV pilus assembly protein PilC